MVQTWKEQYIVLVEFLGRALGPDYEIVLHSFENEEYKIIALANEHVSGRTVSAPLSSLALNFIFTKAYNDSDFKYNYEGVSASGEKLRCSTMFIKDEKGSLLGMLCINHCNEKYNKFAQGIMEFVRDNYQINEVDSEYIESFSNSIIENIEMCSFKVFGVKQLPNHITKQERCELIKELQNRAVFQIKGAITEVSEYTGISKASIYRYLKDTTE